jgi:DNA-binding NtrC family response regulator
VCILFTGTGSAEEIARRVHGLARGRPGRFRAVNCGWPESLLDQQLFYALRPGSSGTVFLEEVGRLSPELQERLFETLDSTADPRGPRPPRARVMASTSESLVQRALEGTFNERLLYRLNAIHVVVPPDLGDW